MTFNPALPKTPCWIRQCLHKTRWHSRNSGTIWSKSPSPCHPIALPSEIGPLPLTAAPLLSSRSPRLLTALPHRPQLSSLTTHDTQPVVPQARRCDNSSSGPGAISRSPRGEPPADYRAEPTTTADDVTGRDVTPTGVTWSGPAAAAVGRWKRRHRRPAEAEMRRRRRDATVTSEAAGGDVGVRWGRGGCWMGVAVTGRRGGVWRRHGVLRDGVRTVSVHTYRWQGIRAHVRREVEV